MLKYGNEFNFHNHLRRMFRFAKETFGTRPNTAGVLNHIRKELAEIEADPKDIYEWVDVMILAIDGARRQGFLPTDIVEALQEKQDKIESRSWPDWRTVPDGQAIEHVRGTND